MGESEGYSDRDILSKRDILTKEEITNYAAFCTDCGHKKRKKGAM